MAKRILSKFVTLPTNTDYEIDVSEKTELYVFNSNVTLTTDVSIITTGTSREGMSFEIFYDGNATLAGNQLQILGTDISNFADETMLVRAIYRNGSWKTAFFNLNTLNIGTDSVNTNAIQDLAVTEAKIADGAIAPSKLEQTEEVIPVTVDITADVNSGYASIPFKCTLTKIKYAILEDLDGDANDVTLDVNINGLASNTSFQSTLSSTASDALRGTTGTLTSSPNPGTQVLSTADDYVELEVSQTSQQGGKIQFFLIVERTD